MRDKQFILIAGYGWSGSSALVDLLKEYNTNIEADVEFRVVKDPYGIADLFESLVGKGDPLNYDTAIKDFLWYMRKLNSKPSKLKRGLNYETFFGNDFMYYTDAYVNALTDFKYKSEWWMFDFKKTTSKLLQDKIKRKIGVEIKDSKMHFSSVSENEFMQLTQEYLFNLFKRYYEGSVSNVILDQGISVLNYKKEMSFFKNPKFIVVDRDPRDIYTDLCSGNYLIGKDLALSRDANKYVKWHNALRKNYYDITSDNEILLIKFEDLILNYENVIKKVELFLGLEERNHDRKYEFFKPEVSAKNIGIWKNYMNKEEIDIFNKELMEYYYQ